MNFIRRIVSIRISHPTISGLWFAFLWMMIGALVLSLLLQSNMLEEQELGLYTYIVHSIAILFGGLVSGKRAQMKGMYQGCITGLIYGILVFVISFLALDSSIQLATWLLLLPALIIGAIGGVFGVNFNRR